MSPVVLLLATATRWVGAARIPEGLAKAGFVPALLAPRDSLIGKSRFVRKMGHLDDHASPSEWVFALAAMVQATEPRLVFPCDELSARLMHALALTPPPDLKPAVHLRIAALIRDSLGDPAHYAASVNKTLLPIAAGALGIRMPASASVETVVAAASFASDHGYPIVLKRAHGAAGDSVVVVPDSGAIADAFARLAAPIATSPFRDRPLPLLAQAFVAGRIVSRSSVAWNGAELAGVTREKVLRHPQTGPGTVMRYYCDPGARSISEMLAQSFGISGFFSAEFVAADGSDELQLLEINRRVSPGSHTGALVGVDLCKALYAAVTGEKSAVPRDVAPDFTRTVARFPQEWLRDAESPYLRDYPVDAPWDDPVLFEAYLALRHES